MSAAEEAEFCDGVKLMAWLRDVEPKLFGKRWEGSPGQVRPMIGDNWNRRFYDWDRGTRPSVYTVDKLMVALGRHLLEIPDECFVERMAEALPEIPKEQIDMHIYRLQQQKRPVTAELIRERHVAMNPVRSAA